MIQTLYTIRCDGHGCIHDLWEPHSTRRDAIEAAENTGWLIQGSKTYCPSCRDMYEKLKFTNAMREG